MLFLQEEISNKEKHNLEKTKLMINENNETTPISITERTKKVSI